MATFGKGCHLPLEKEGKLANSIQSFHILRAAILNSLRVLELGKIPNGKGINSEEFGSQLRHGEDYDVDKDRNKDRIDQNRWLRQEV